MLTANYHAHTWRCSHASGTEQEYVQAVLDRGMEVFGFSDHTPYPFPWYHLSWFRMKQEQLEEYVNTIHHLRRLFPQIQIPVGLEAEYYPAYFEELKSVLKDSGVEYLLLGQHYLENEIGAHYSGNATADQQHLKQYCRQTMDAMQTGLYTYFAHPDLINFHGSEGLYTEQIRGLCREANACGIPLEVNLLGIEKEKHYPNIRFWRIAAEENCKVILGCDTHDPASLRSRKPEETAMAMIAELGLHRLDRVELRPVF